jgi:hypothetical protein
MWSGSTLVVFERERDTAHGVCDIVVAETRYARHDHVRALRVLGRSVFGEVGRTTSLTTSKLSGVNLL